MKAERENKASEKGMKRESGHPNSVSSIEHTHAGERGHQGGVVFKIPQGLCDHSDVMSTPEHKG
jgi:hypothetical protein